MQTNLLTRAAACMIGLAFSCGVWSQPAPALPEAAKHVEPPERLAWHERMLTHKMPHAGCFVAGFPNEEWKEVPCAHSIVHDPKLKKFDRKLVPPHGLAQVGDGVDYSGEAVGGTIASGEGSFDQVTDVTTVQSIPPGSSTGAPGAFSLQLNSSWAASTACANADNAANSGCSALVQFLMMTSNVHAYVFMEYWLSNFSTNCPGSGGKPQLPDFPSGSVWWHPTGEPTVCVFDGPTVQLDPQLVTNLGKLKLLGTAETGGMDSIMFTAQNGQIYGEASPDDIFALAANWQVAEFNVFGRDNSQQAVFNNNAAVVVHLKLNNGTSNAPTLINGGVTAETNNLTLATLACPTSGSLPELSFLEAYAASELSKTCPPAPIVPKVPPTLKPNCKGLMEAVTVAEEELAKAQQHSESAICKGSASVDCLMAVKRAQENLVGAEAAYKKACPPK